MRWFVLFLNDTPIKKTIYYKLKSFCLKPQYFFFFTIFIHFAQRSYNIVLEYDQTTAILLPFDMTPSSAENWLNPFGI